MKHKKLTSCLCAAVLAFLLGFGSVACMVTGLQLPVELSVLACGCAIGALVATVCFTVQRGSLILSGIAAVYSLIIVFRSEFWEQLRAMCYSAMSYYNRGYGIPIPGWIEGQITDSQLSPVMLIAGLVMAAAAWTVLHRKRSFLVVAAALLPLASCLVVTDTVPHILPIFLLLLGLVLLMMTQSVRRQDEAQGSKLTGILFLPATAALLALVSLVPQGDYSAPDQMNSLQDILDWFSQRIPFVDQTTDGELVISIGGNASDNVNLTRIGHRQERNTPVMEIVTEYSGTLYLRGRDYDVYTGLGWEATDDRTESGYGPSEIWRSDDMQAAIRVLGRRGQYYLPCYPTENQTLIGGMLSNPDYETTYSYTFSTLRPDWRVLYQYCETGLVSMPSEPSADKQYLELPDETRQEAEAILENLIYDVLLDSGYGDLSNLPADDRAQTAEAIGNYVRASARYDLNPGRMPSSESDFAMWFLQESDTGYCVHFASAATVLLRAAGIPARYVEGYTVVPQSGQTTIVREKMAHAWVEYYLDYVGWVILDPTPGSSEAPEETTASVESTTAPTTPSVTDSTLPATEPADSTPSDTSGQSGQNPGTSAPSHIIDLPGNGSGGDAMITVPQWFLNLLGVLAWVAGIGVLIVGQWLLRRYLKLNRMRWGKPNTQALSRYREVQRIVRLCKLSVPDELLQLAEKAKFSQYELTKEELGRFDAFLRNCVQSLRKKPWYCRLIFRFVFAAY